MTEVFRFHLIWILNEEFLNDMKRLPFFLLILISFCFTGMCVMTFETKELRLFTLQKYYQKLVENEIMLLCTRQNMLGLENILETMRLSYSTRRYH